MARVKGGGRERGDCGACSFNLGRWVEELRSNFPEVKIDFPTFEMPDLADMEAMMAEQMRETEKLMREMEESRKERRVIRWAWDGEEVEVNFPLGTVTVRRLDGGVELEIR
jgi:hypothetical protein